MTETKRGWLRGLPKAEIHLHLEGTITPETLVTLSQRHDKTPFTLEEARALYSYKDFPHFLSIFRLLNDHLQTPEDYSLIARAMMQNLHEQGVVHAEVYIAWGNILHFRPHLKVEDVMNAVEGARLQIERELGGPSIFWIADASRSLGVEATGVVFRMAAELRERFPTIVGVGIGGNETDNPIEWFRDPYRKAKEAGLRLTAHVGETTGPIKGPLQIREALAMDVERIGHGLAAQHDEELMDILAKRQIPVEINITSNILTGCCPSVEVHPLPQYLQRGMLCTLNSDDPTMFGCSCLGEYALASESYHLGLEEMKGLARNSINASFLSDERKMELINRVDNYSG
ncbi:Metallo-dependent hydrolase [Thozetella sp. PMI_491]|nr:Metallo-dependent hydrolase [Thozetella sp. PMI_491]